MQPIPQQSHARYCGSIALPISREPEHFSEQDHAASEYGALSDGTERAQTLLETLLETLRPSAT